MLSPYIGIEGTKARFIGVYRVLGRRTGKDVPLPSGCPFTEWTKNPYYYDLKREPGYEDLENRMVIEWGRGALAWQQRLSNKEIIEIQPEGTLLPTFRDYLEINLTYSELKYLYEHEDVNREWRARLSAVAGVYLVLASTTGAQYVGSASGTTGIWGRWEEYARNGHAGNKLLQNLVEKDKAYPEAFTFSLLLNRSQDSCSSRSPSMGKAI